MGEPTFVLAVKLRVRQAAMTAFGVAAVTIMVGALFPAVGGSIGKLNLPDGVAELLGGADYGTLLGWMRSEIGAIYGPLVIGAIAIAAAAGSMAGEERDGTLALVLAHPLRRRRLVLEKSAAVGVSVLVVAAGSLAGLLAGVAIGGGGVAALDLLALCVHLAFFGLAVGAVAMALAAATGRSGIATGGAASFAIAGFLINGFAPFVAGLDWLKYLSVFHYYAGHDPIANGFDVVDLAVLAALVAASLWAGILAFERRDLQG